MKTRSLGKAMSFLALAAIVGTAGMGAKGSAANRQESGSGTEKTLTGVVSDTMCRATHMSKTMTSAECTRACVKAGQKYALIVDKHAYTLKGHEADLDKYAGQKVMLKGALSGETVTVESVSPAK